MTSSDFRKMFLKDLIFVICFVGLFLFFIQPTIVRQTSMYPTFNDGDYLLVSRQTYKIKDVKRGDVVVFKEAEQGDTKRLLIKRVIGLPGDELEIRDSVLYINGSPQDEPYVRENSEFMDKTQVGQDEYFCMGDNRQNSMDSRELGAIPKDKFVGKVLIRLYPFDKIAVKF